MEQNESQKTNIESATTLILKTMRKGGIEVDGPPKSVPFELVVAMVAAAMEAMAEATPPAAPAPEAAGEAGERVPDLVSRNALRYMAEQKYAEYPSHRTAYDFIRLPELLREYAVTLQELRQARLVAEDAFQLAARLQQELAEARGYTHTLELWADAVKTIHRNVTDGTLPPDALATAIAALSAPEATDAAAEPGEGRGS